MPLYAKQEGSNIEPIPADTYHAICYGVVDLGHQINLMFGNSQHKICLLFELPDLTIDIKDGKTVRRTISKIYTMSLNEKSNLYKDLISWRGQEFTDEELDGFDVFVLAGINCLLTIVNTTKGKKTYSNIGSISKLMKSMPKMKPENELIKYSIQDDGLNNVPESLPQWIKDTIKKSEEAGAGEPEPVDDMSYDYGPVADDSEIPF